MQVVRNWVARSHRVTRFWAWTCEYFWGGGVQRRRGGRRAGWATTWRCSSFSHSLSLWLQKFELGQSHPKFTSPSGLFMLTERLTNFSGRIDLNHCSKHHFQNVENGNDESSSAWQFNVHPLLISHKLNSTLWQTFLSLVLHLTNVLPLEQSRSTCRTKQRSLSPRCVCISVRSLEISSANA